MPNNKIGSISTQWSKIGGKKSTGTPDNQDAAPSVSQSPEPVEPQSFSPSKYQDTQEQNNQDTHVSGVQTSELPNNKLTKPQNIQDFELQDYEWSDRSESEDTGSADDLVSSTLDNKATKGSKNQTTKRRGGQSSSDLNKEGTRTKIVQYTREVKPERLRQTVYLYPEVLRWIKRRIAETDEEISDVANYTAELNRWLEEKHPEIIARFEKQRKRE
jgi:hypothetical protein